MLSSIPEARHHFQLVAARYSILDFQNEDLSGRQLIVNLSSEQECQELVNYIKDVSKTCGLILWYENELSTNGKAIEEEQLKFEIRKTNDLGVEDYYVTFSEIREGNTEQDPYSCIFLRGMLHCWLAKKLKELNPIN